MDPNPVKANASRSLLFLILIAVLSACVPDTPTPLPAPTPTTRVIIVVATNPPVTATKVPSPTPAPSNTPLQLDSTPPTITRAPTNTSTPKPPTPTRRAATRAPTQAPPTEPPPPPTQAPPTEPPPPPTAPATLAPPAAFTPSELIVIPEGHFGMGSRTETDEADEKPYHEVKMYEYRIEKDEVTNAQYQACVAAGACSPPVKSSSYTRPSYFGNPDFANFPVVNVTWQDADTYCKWLGRRLPNEAEWEHAARGTENWKYTWSSSLGMHFEWNAIFHGSPISFCEASCPLPTYWTDVNDGWADTAPVGWFSQYDSSSGFGVIDMAGNVAEWTNNWYDPNAYTDGNDIYGPGDPTGTKVVRGGSWANEPVRNSDREPVAPDQASDRIGFRCAQ